MNYTVSGDVSLFLIPLLVPPCVGLGMWTKSLTQDIYLFWYHRHTSVVVNQLLLLFLGNKARGFQRKDSQEGHTDRPRTNKTLHCAAVLIGAAGAVWILKMVRQVRRGLEEIPPVPFFIKWSYLVKRWTSKGKPKEPDAGIKPEKFSVFFYKSRFLLFNLL